MARPKKTNKDRQPIMEKEFNLIIQKTKRSKTLFRSTKNKLLAGYTLLYCSGGRISEVAKLTKWDLEKMITLRYHILTETKTDTIEMFQFNDDLIEILESIDTSYTTNYLFPKNGSSKHMTVGGLTDLMNRHLKDQLNVLYTTHSFRGGYITHVYDCCKNLQTTAQLARHKNTSTTQIYVHSTPEQQKEALNLAFGKRRVG